MKKFIVKILLFICPIIAFAVLMEVLLRIIPNDYSVKKQYLDLNSNKIETLILGSSHSFYGLNPVYFSDNTFNASHISQSLNYDFEILNKYQAEFRNLKNIVIPISYFTLFGKLDDGAESWRVKNYTIYYGLNFSKSFTEHFEMLSNKLSTNAGRLYLYYFQQKSNISCTKLGWGTNYNSMNALDLYETGISAAKRHSKDIYTESQEKTIRENVSTLHLIIYWCRVNNINLYFFTPPAFKTYRANLNTEQLHLTVKTMNKICSENDNCIYDNLIEDKSFIAADYYDADHLSEIGAKKLSVYVNEKLSNW